MIAGFIKTALLAFAVATAANNTPWVARQIGKVFPVVTPITVTSTAATSVGGADETVISGWAIKHYGRCKFQGVFFYAGKLGGVPVAAVFNDPPKVRSGGRQEWDGLMVAVPENGLWLLEGEVLHSCFGVNVRSPFFP